MLDWDFPDNGLLVVILSKKCCCFEKLSLLTRSLWWCENIQSHSRASRIDLQSHDNEIYAILWNFIKYEILVVFGCDSVLTSFIQVLCRMSSILWSFLHGKIQCLQRPKFIAFMGMWHYWFSKTISIKHKTSIMLAKKNAGIVTEYLQLLNSWEDL